MYDTVTFNKIFSKNIEIIFNKLIKEDFIDTQSNFFLVSKERASKMCFQTFYPLIEYFNNFSETHFDFFFQNTYLFIWSFFLDQSLDSLENNIVKRIRSFQISSYLLLNYFEWLAKTHKSKLPIFYNYYKEQTNYLIIEKKWEFPQLYHLAYGSEENIYKKAVILLFPLDLNKRNLFICKPQILKDLFINYYSFLLLADDLVDINSDINSHCLTYPIAFYFKLKGKLPRSSEDFVSILPHFIESLQKFLDNIKNLEISISKNSSIINNTIINIKGKLNKAGIKI